MTKSALEVINQCADEVEKHIDSLFKQCHDCAKEAKKSVKENTIIAKSCIGDVPQKHKSDVKAAADAIQTCENNFLTKLFEIIVETGSCAYTDIFDNLARRNGVDIGDFKIKIEQFLRK